MTSNQINAAYQREDARHNDRVETETQRHNEETERLEQEKLELTDRYNQKMADLTEDYNNKYIEYLNASEEDKVALESELNFIKEQQMEADRQYKSEMSALGWSQADVDKAYKEGLTAIGWYNADIESKRAYYENQRTESQTSQIYASIQNARTELRLQENRIENEYRLGLMTLEQRNKELALARDEYNLKVQKFSEAEKPQATQAVKESQQRVKESEQKTKESKARTRKTTVETATMAIDSVSGVIDSIIPF